MYTVVVRAVRSLDGMTANFSHIEPKILERISSRITNEVAGVGRVLYDITNKPPATVELE
jgi:GMP synthase (glutamine-hydrolysing)